MKIDNSNNKNQDTNIQTNSASQGYDSDSKFTNFKSALKELINGETEAEYAMAEGSLDMAEVPAPEPEPELQPAYEETPAAPLPSDPEPEPEPEETLQEVFLEGDEPEEFKDVAVIESDSLNPGRKTVIARDVELTGDIKSKGDIDVLGDIIGNITAGGHVMIAGTVAGSIIAESASLENGSLTGDSIQVNSHITVKSGFEINAQVQALSLDVNGKIQGNITIMDQLTIHEGANIKGDISTQYISVQKGAVINGNLTVNQG